MTEMLSERIQTLAESATIKMSQLARELTDQGKDIINLSLGEPDFSTPKHVLEAGIRAINDGHTHYTPVPGYMDLRQAISDKFKRDNNLVYAPDQIVVSTGAKQSLINVVLSLVNPGDEVIIPIPYWVSYAAMAHLSEGQMVTIPTSIESDFKITADQLEAAITDKSRLMIFSSPCNPSGSVYSKEELASLAEVIAKHPNFYVISDEIYEYINFTGKHESLAQFDNIYDQVITVNGFSKGFAMTGWRVGYIGAPKAIAKACSKMQGQFTSGTCAIAQKAAQVAISSDLAPTYFMRDAFLARRELIFDLINDIDGISVNRPDGAFYLFPDFSSYFGKQYNGETIKDSDDLALYLLSEGGVSLVSGGAFGDPNCMRISFAASDEALKEAAARIKTALGKLS